MANNLQTLRSLHLKIITGYLLLIALFLFVIFHIYRKNTKLVEMDKQVTAILEQRQLTEIATIQILDLALLGEQMLGWDEKEFALYSRKRDSLITTLYQLHEQLPDPKQQKRINAIIELLPLKEKYIFATLSDLQQLRGSYTLLQQRIPSIIRTNKKQQEKLTRQIRQNYDSGKEKTGGFLGLFSSTKKSRYLIERKNREAMLENQSQSDIQLHSLTNEIERRQQESTEKLIAHADSLSRQNTRLNRQMCRLITDFNQTSQAIQQQTATTYRQEQQRALKTISGLGIGAILLAFLFYLLLQKDLKKRHRVRMELVRMNSRNEELLTARKNMMLTVSHDLRTPLSSISGYAELIPEEPDKKKRDKFVDNILRSSRNMLYLVNSLLNFYRLDTGKETVQASTFHIKSYMEHASAYFEPQIRKKNLRFETVYEGPDVFINGDKERLWAIIINLVSNAIKFTPAGEVKLLATYTDNELTLIVQDTGLGMTEEEIKRSFLAFERLGNATGQEGFGLGLSIINALVSLLKGTIEVQSIPDFGSRFTVRLPMPIADEKDFETQMAERQLPSLTGLRVLVIDDDPLQLCLTKEFFSGNQIRCDCCRNVKELFDHLQKTSYQLIMTDIQMEPVNGIGVLKLLRSSNIGQTRTVPVLAVTARMDRTEADYIKSGFCGTLSKPFSKEELFNTVSRYADSPPGNNNRTADFSVLLSKESNQEEMIDLFIGQAGINIRLLKEALERNDGRAVAGITHKVFPIWTSINPGLSMDQLQQLAKIDSDEIPSGLEEQVISCIHAGETLLEQAIQYQEQLNHKINENDTDHRR